MQIPLIKGIKTSIQSQFSDALLENMLTNPDPVLNTNGYLSSHAGLKKVSDSVDGVSRGGVYNSRFNIAFRVVGNQLITLDDSGNYKSSLGFIDGEGQVAMPFSFNTQAIITQQGQMYLVDETLTITEVTDPNLGAVFDGVWIDGYYFLVDSESPIVTDILAEDNIRQLNYGSAEIEPDPIRGCDKWRNFAVVFGSNTMEFYDNVGGTNFPFQRIESYTIYTGIVGTHAKVKLPKEAGFFILGNSKGEKPSFHIAVSGSTVNVSNKEVDRIISSYSEYDLSQTKIEYVRDDNQEFIYCHLVDKTLVYDITTSAKFGYYQWSILKTGWECQESFKGYWQGINFIPLPFINEYSLGNRNDGTLMLLDRDNCTQLDKQQEHVIYSPLFLFKQQTIYDVQPEMVNGNNSINRDESIALSSTEDGRSYSTEHFYNFGDRGARWDQVIWRRVGFIRNWWGCKLRYVGRTNITLASLKVNENE